MKTGVRVLRFILLAIWGTFVVRGEETSPRLAVVPESFDPALAAFGDLLTAELSTSPQKFALVKRAELQRLSQEQSLQSMNAAARPIALARLVKADGLVFLGKDATDPKKPCFNVRLAACGNGLILRSLRLSAEEKEMATAEQGASAFAEMLEPRNFYQGNEPPGRVLRSCLWRTFHHSEKSSPWLPVVDWSGAGRDRVAWKALIRKLASSTELISQVDSLALEFQQVLDLRAQDEIMGRYCELLEKHSRWFFSAEGQRAFDAFGAHWLGQSRIFPPVHSPRWFDLLLRLFAEAEWLEPNIYNQVSCLLIHGLPDNEARRRDFIDQERAAKLLSVFDAYLARAKRHPNWEKADREKILFQFSRLKSEILDAFPELKVDKIVAPSVAAIRVGVWSPSLEVTPQPSPSWIDGSHLCWDGERLLVPLAGNRIYALDPHSMQGSSFTCPDHYGKHWSMAVANGGMMVYADGFHLSDYRANGPWRRLDDPGFKQEKPAHWEVSACNGSFYFGVSSRYFIRQDSDRALFQTRIGKYQGGHVEWVVSSSRVPLKHILDGKRPRGLVHVFPGYQGKSLAVMDFPNEFSRHYYELEPGTYRMELSSAGMIQKNGERVLEWGAYKGELLHIIAFDPDKERAELWMRKPRSVNGISALRNGWEKATPLLNAGRSEFEGEVIAPIVHEGKLWLLKWEPCLPPRQPHALRLVAIDLKTLRAVTVPLYLDIPERIRAIKAVPGLDLGAPMIEEESLTASPHGLYFTARADREGGYQDWVRSSPVLFHVRWLEVNEWIEAQFPGFKGP